MAKEIKTDEWLRELERVQRSQPDQEGFTTIELSRAFGKGEAATRKIVRRLIEQGSVEPVRIRRKCILNGITQPVYGYQLVKSQSQKKKGVS